MGDLSLGPIRDGLATVVLGFASRITGLAFAKVVAPQPGSRFGLIRLFYLISLVLILIEEDARLAFHEFSFYGKTTTSAKKKVWLALDGSKAYTQAILSNDAQKKLPKGGGNPR